MRLEFNKLIYHMKMKKDSQGKVTNIVTGKQIYLFGGEKIRKNN